MNTFNYRLQIAYHGAHFCGYQSQKTGQSIEEALQTAFLKLNAPTSFMVAAGRTDSGVHAKGQVVSAQINVYFEPRKLTLALNHFLPKTIRVLQTDAMPMGFHAQKHAIGKRYVYYIWNHPQEDPFYMDRSLHVAKALDLSSMQEAANYFIGEHDFESFRSVYCQAAHARRYIWYFEITKKGASIQLDIRGNAFCHNQIRIMTGTLIAVGLFKLKPHDIKTILEAKNRTKAGKTALAQGLFLDKIYYPDNCLDAKIPNNACFKKYPVTKETWPF